MTKYILALELKKCGELFHFSNIVPSCIIGVNLTSIIYYLLFHFWISLLNYLRLLVKFTHFSPVILVWEVLKFPRFVSELGRKSCSGLPYRSIWACVFISNFTFCFFEDWRGLVKLPISNRLSF